MMKLYVGSEFVEDGDDVMRDDDFKHETIGHEDDFQQFRGRRYDGFKYKGQFNYKGDFLNFQNCDDMDGDLDYIKQKIYSF